MSMTTSKQVKHIPNPSGKGGFRERPQDRSSGHWDSKLTLSYQYRRFMQMPIIEFDNWLSSNKDSMTVVEHLAYIRLVTAKLSLPDVKEITDRTEGKAPQSIDHTSKGEILSNIIYLPRKRDDFYDMNL